LPKRFGAQAGAQSGRGTTGRGTGTGCGTGTFLEINNFNLDLKK